MSKRRFFHRTKQHSTGAGAFTRFKGRAKIILTWLTKHIYEAACLHHENMKNSNEYRERVKERVQRTINKFPASSRIRVVLEALQGIYFGTYEYGWGL